MSKKYFDDSFSEEVWRSTYKDVNDNTVEDTFRRVAKAIASAETTEEKRREYEEKFFDEISNFRIVPGGRILSNAGASFKGAGLINCYTGGRPDYDADSIEGIINVLRNQVLTLKSEGGWGLNFSWIRPRSSVINSIGVSSPGAVKFMEFFDKSSDIITAGGGEEGKNKKMKGKIRKGAMMGILSDFHPDLIEFITAKQSPGRLSKFNISVACSQKFMDKVIEAKESENPDSITWDFVFPDTKHPEYKSKWNGDINKWKSYGFDVVIYKTVPVLDAWNLIIKSTYNRAEPGILFLDRANDTYLANYLGDRIQESNACSEQTMPQNSSCNLLSINLAKYFNGESFDFEKLKNTAKIALRFSDNVNDVAEVPIKEYLKSVREMRRVGIGILGWGSLLYLMNIRFASDEAEKLKDKIMSTIYHTIVDESIELAKEKGAFTGCNPKKQTEHCFFKQINVPEKTMEKMKKYGIRNSSLFSIQPTGNTSIFAGVVSGGCEPIFLQEYIRTVIVNNPTTEIDEKILPKYWEGQFVETDVFKFAKEGDEQILKATIDGIVYKIDKNRGLTKEVLCEDYAVRKLKQNGKWDKKSSWAVTTANLTVEDHIKDLNGFAKWTDASISKTVNIPNDYPFEKFENVYLDAYKSGVIKGITTYREGTMTSVLSAVKEDDKPINTEEKIIKNNAPKRPKKLLATVDHITLKGEKYYVAIGFLGNDPYEVFTGRNDSFIPAGAKHGEIIKYRGGDYSFIHNDKEYKLNNGNSEPTVNTITRMVSCALRHGSSLHFIVDQLQKSEGGDFSSFDKVLARSLKKLIKENTKSSESCPACGTKLTYQEGCKKCSNCGHSACS